MPRLRIQKGNIGISIGGFSTKGSDSVSGSVPGLNISSEWNPDENQFTHESSLGIVWMWDEPFWSYWENEDYTYDPDKGKTKYSASRDFNLNTYFFQFDAPVTQHLRALAGLRQLKWGISDNQSVNGVFRFPYEYSDYWEYPDGSWEYWEVTGIYEDLWNLKATSKAELTSLGLEIGLAGKWPITKRLSIGADFSRSWLSGEVKENGMFLDIDTGSDQWEGYYEYYDAYYDEYYEDSWSEESNWTLTGKIPFSMRHSSTIDMTEIGINLSYSIGDRITFGIGYAKVILNNLPLPARFHYVGQREEGTPYWETERTTDASFEGYRVVLEYKF
jgi:hypothetical protein